MPSGRETIAVTKKEIKILCDKLDKIEKGIMENKKYLKGDKEVVDDRGIIGDVKDIKRALFGDTRTGSTGLIHTVEGLNMYRSKLNKALFATWTFIVGIIGKWIYTLMQSK